MRRLSEALRCVFLRVDARRRASTLEHRLSGSIVTVACFASRRIDEKPGINSLGM